MLPRIALYDRHPVFASGTRRLARRRCQTLELWVIVVLVESVSSGSQTALGVLHTRGRPLRPAPLRSAH